MTAETYSPLSVLAELWHSGLEPGHGAPDLLLFTHRIVRLAERDWEPHAHPDHELLWAVTGEVTVVANGREHVLRSAPGLWIPAGVEHSVRTGEGASLSCTWFRAQKVRIDVDEPVGLLVPPLLGGVLRHIDDLRLEPQERRRAELFALDLLGPEALVPADVPLPTSPDLRRVAATVRANPAIGWGIDGWARSTNLSVRTFTRRFAAETGTSFARWRLAVRVHAAVRLLAEGQSVGAVSRAVGYPQPGSFISAFRRVTGMTPGSYAALVAGKAVAVRADGRESLLADPESALPDIAVA